MGGACWSHCSFVSAGSSYTPKFDIDFDIEKMKTDLMNVKLRDRLLDRCGVVERLGGNRN